MKAESNNIYIDGGKFKNLEVVSLYNGSVNDGGSFIDNTITIKNNGKYSNFCGISAYNEFNILNNKLIIEGGDFTNFIGIYNYTKEYVRDIKDNEIEIQGGTFTNNFYAFKIDSYKQLNNTLTIKDGNFENATIYLSSTANSGQIAVPNILNFKTNKNFKVKGLNNAFYLNFELPSDIANGETLIQVTDAVNLAPIKEVGLSIKDSKDLTNLIANNYVNLISSQSGVFTYAGNTEAKAVVGATKAYDFDIKIDIWHRK